MGFYKKSIFEYKENNYFVEVVFVKRYLKQFKCCGIEIGYGQYVFCKKITFGFENQNYFVEANYNKSVTYIKGLFSKIEDELKNIINDDDIVTFFAVGESRRTIFNTILKINGFNKLGDCYFKRRPMIQLYRHHEIFGFMFERLFTK